MNGKIDNEVYYSSGNTTKVQVTKLLHSSGDKIDFDGVEYLRIVKKPVGRRLVKKFKRPSDNMRVLLYN